MYLATPMTRFEYMRIPVSVIPPAIMDLYKLHAKVKNGYIYVQIEKGMYGLPQAGILANQLLRERLKPHGYYEVPHTPGLWKHKHLPVQFTLVVDDFGVKYTGNHAQHLVNALKETYEIKEDWTGALYCGIHLKWDYEKRILDTSMQGYVEKQLRKYKHKKTTKPQNTPLQPFPRQYGKNAQQPIPTDDSPPINTDQQKFIEQVVGSFLYYARAVDPIILHALSNIASEQKNPTTNTLAKTHRFLDYMAWHPDAIVRFRKSDMILNIHSDASYLTAPKSRSRAGGHYFLGSIPRDNHPIKLNGPIHSLCTILRFVAASAAEAELGALFLNAKEAKIMRLTLEELGHPQPPTPIHIDNTTVVGIVNNTIKRQRSRSMEMRYFWLLDSEAQKYFTYHYHPGQENLADYHTKSFNGKDTTHARPFYVYERNSPKELVRALLPSTRRGCVGKLRDSYLHRRPLPTIPTYKVHKRTKCS